MVDGERLDRTDCRPYSRYKVKRWGLVMKIGELAARAACDVQTVRYYEREGLLEAPAREASGYRRYGRAHLARLQFIRHCRSLEIPLSQVRQLVAFARSPSESCAAVDSLVDGHIARVRQQMDALAVLERRLVALRSECRGEHGHACAIIDAFSSAPAAHACACHRA
jgi:DNA-binding transcriptional MerR regulator